MTDTEHRPLTREAIEEAIATFVRESPLNRLDRIDGTPIFYAPLVGVADGDDPLFARYREIIGAFHRTPREALAADVGHDEPPHVSVIAWILPIAQRTREGNRERERTPSRRWAHSKQYGEELNLALRRHMVGLCQAAGYAACAPLLSDEYRVFRAEAVRPPSANWSERHIAYAAGLGTFGLSDGLITPVGIAHRCGSVVTALPLAATPRPYKGPYDYCLHYRGIPCGACIQRCPAGAISDAGHDKAACGAYLHTELLALHTDEYGVSDLTCGLCQTGVPCECGIPE